MVLDRIRPTLWIPAAVALMAGVAIFLWIGGTGRPDVPRRLPGSDGAAAALAALPAGPVRGELTPGDGRASERPGNWPQFRGPERTGVAAEGGDWAHQWPTNGPRLVWSLTVGEGHAGAAVWKGRVYVIDYDRDRHRDVIRCLSLDDGRDLWRYSYPVSIKRNHGMSRTVPALADGLLVALGPKCHVTALDALSGERRWAIDLVREYGTTVPPWYAGQCPLIDGGRVILAPAGKVLLLAVDARTGEPVWTTPNPRGWRMTHSSILPVELAGRSQYVYCGSDGVAGVAADDGALLWATGEWKISIANVPTPVAMGANRILLSGGYNAGAAILEVQAEGTGYVARLVKRFAPQVFGSDQQTPIYCGGHVYGVKPGGELVCLAPDGTIRWTSGPEHRFGIGPYTVAADRLLLMNDAGRLTMAQLSADAFQLLAEAPVLHGHDSWGPMAVAGDYLIVRDLTTLACLDMKTTSGGAP